MSKFIFIKNSDNLYRIVENENDVIHYNYDSNFYDLIEVSSQNFNNFKLSKIKISSKSNNQIIFENIPFISGPRPTLGQSTPIIEPTGFTNESLKLYIKSVLKPLNEFLNVNHNHVFYSTFNSYKETLENLNVDSLIAPNSSDLFRYYSLEQYLEESGVTTFNPLQIP